MSSPSLERVQHDLDVIKSVLPADFPYDRGSVAANVWAGVCGIPLALRAVPGWDRSMLLILLALIVGLMAFHGGWLRRVRSERGVRPRRWLWNREEAVCSVIAIVGLLAYIGIIRWSAAAAGSWSFAAWRGQIAGPVLFAFGIGLILHGVVRTERRSWLGWGLPVLAAGLAAPWVTSAHAFHVIIGMVVTFGGLISAAVLWRQVREAEASA